MPGTPAHAHVLDDVPQPDLAGHDDVLIGVGGSGLWRTDLHLIGSWFADVPSPERPFTFGHETARWVEEVWSNVKNVRPGGTVIVHPLRPCGACWRCRHEEGMCCAYSAFPGVNADGGYAGYLRTSARSLVVLPDGVRPADVPRTPRRPDRLPRGA